MVCDDSRHLACIRVSRQAGFDGVRPAKQLSSVSKPEAPFNVSAMTADMNTHTHSLSLSLSLSLFLCVCVCVCALQCGKQGLAMWGPIAVYHLLHEHCL